MSICDWFMQLNKTHLLVAVMSVLIITLLILNHRKQNQIYALYNASAAKPTIQINENFDAAKLPQGKKTQLSVYYTDWCGYSQQFLPVWAEFEKYVAENKLNLTMVKIDCEKEKEKCQSVPGFPTIVLEADGKRIEMGAKYPRTVAGLMKFLEENL